MMTRTALGLLLVSTLALNSGEAFGQGLRSDSKVKVQATAGQLGPDGKQSVTVRLAIDKGWHLYANPVGNPDLASSQTQVKFSNRTQALQVAYPPGRLVKDSTIGDYKVYDGDVTIQAIVQRGPGDTGPLELSVSFQACDDRSCLLPSTIKVMVR